MRLNEIITERGDVYFDKMNRVYFNSEEALKRAENSDWDKMRLAAKDFRDRNPQVGKHWRKDWNAQPQQDQYASQMTMPKAKQELPSLIPNRAGLNKADLGRPDDGISAIAGADVEPEPTMPMGGIAGVIRRKQQK